MKNESIIKQKEIENRIFTIRGMQVMLDEHLAELYDVGVKVLNQAVKRNPRRFPEGFMFQLTSEEWSVLRSQVVTLKTEPALRSQPVTLEENRGKHRKYLPYVFTEAGVAMLSAVLRSDMAVNTSILIIQAFVEMRKVMLNNALMYQRLDKLEIRQSEADQKFEQIFKALESKQALPEKGIFFDGQIYDAYVFVANLIRKASKSIVLIDNYIDDTILSQFIKRTKGVRFTIYTRSISKQFELDISKHNAQYEPVVVKELKQVHDRFLVIDETELYHIGASLKDLGKSWFAFSRMDSETIELLNQLKLKA